MAPDRAPSSLAAPGADGPTARGGELPKPCIRIDRVRVPRSFEHRRIRDTVAVAERGRQINAVLLRESASNVGLAGIGDRGTVQLAGEDAVPLHEPVRDQFV